MGKHFAPKASSYTDASYIERCAAAYRNGGNWRSMITMLNQADRMRFNHLIEEAEVADAAKAVRVSDSIASRILARQLGER